MSEFKYDVLIIGTGIAGLSSAIKLAENFSNKSDFKIGLVTRAQKPEHSNTYWAQGGIIYPEKNDHDLKSDIQSASSNTSYEKAIDFLLKNSRITVDEVLIKKAKTPFKKDELGKLKFTQEAAHSRARIIYEGDATGKSIEISLLNYLSSFKNIEILTKHTAIDLITASHNGISFNQRYENDSIVGAYIYDQENNKVKKVISKKTILATGGIGALFSHNTNAEGARGDGHAMARRAGAKLLNMGFIQFHPTTFYDTTTDRRFLISEAVRGEGAQLVDSKGNTFMEKYHVDGAMAPRDIVSKSIVNEMIEKSWDCVYLDSTNKTAEELRSRFPTIFNYLKNKNINMAKDLIPVVPAAHYTCGGVKVDLDGKTNLENLYAVGEVACTGLHGANRLASTSLLEGLVWGYKAGESISEELNDMKFYDASKIKDWSLGNIEVDLALIAQDKMVIKETMWNYVGINKTRNRLMRARAMFFELNEQIQKFYKNAALHDELIGLRNSVEVGMMVISSSLKETRLYK